MCRAFQTAEAVKAGEATSVLNPSEARWLFTRVRVCEARSDRTVPQSAAGEQSPARVVAFARGVTTPAVPTAVARRAHASNAERAQRMSVLFERAREELGDVGGVTSIRWKESTVSSRALSFYWLKG
jgi:hypothetical protein